jgi:hypothetical protein
VCEILCYNVLIRRADTAMTAAIFGLRDEELAALAHWAAGK